LINLTIKLTGNKTPILVNILTEPQETLINQIEELGKQFNEINFVLSNPILEKKDSNLLLNYFETIFETSNAKNPIYLYNNYHEFAKNEINPAIVKNLLKYSNFNGIIDPLDNINFCKDYINLIKEDFTFICSKEENFQKFFQLIPLKLRKFAGILPNISNLVNLCSKLYFCALEEKILELYQIQEQVIDIINKVYDIKSIEGKEPRGLKYAFLYLYRDILPFAIDELNILSPKFSSKLDEITKGRIEAIVKYLLNQKFIYQLYTLGKKEIYQLDEIIKRFSTVKILVNQGKIKKIIGPFDGEHNTIYRVNFENNELIFRFRTSNFFQYEEIIKEKLLFPFLDGSLTQKSPDLRGKIKNIISTKIGDYLFNKQNPPIIPVGNLIYFDETKQTVPYFFTVQEYIYGNSLDNVLNQYLAEDSNFNKSKFLNLFNSIGELLGKLHSINFNSFQENILKIGKKTSIKWLDLFNSQIELQIQEAKRNKLEFDKEIEKYFKEYESLIEEEDEAVLVHNDFQCKNIIVNEESSIFNINGIIDFDEWGIGVPAQDFVKMELNTFKSINNPNLRNKFYESYSKFHRFHHDFYKKIELYCVFSLLKGYNVELEKIRNVQYFKLSEKYKSQSDYYLNEIKHILEIH
jgi:Ser/Thr protein kinase RdoA (MazF antagonist)/dihydrodipicolinate synthase/N-acetylneuraminate lyase